MSKVVLRVDEMKMRFGMKVKSALEWLWIEVEIFNEENFKLWKN